tara:strand:- start:13011 stop:14801 length:1791 start_codon:yes stop_codon:yes gene_type:complete
MARKEITAWEQDQQMWGWFAPENRSKGVKTPLYVRALVVRSQTECVAYLCADIGFISVGLRRALLALLQLEHPTRGFGPHNVMLTATHTHSGPNGYSDRSGQNSASFGFSPLIFSTILEGMVAALIEADDKCEPAQLRLGHVHIPHQEPVAFNRSLTAFRHNPEVSSAQSKDKTLATRRKTVTLRIDDAQGRCIGSVNWFAVHATSVHAENDLIHSDNKGLAACMWEDELRESPQGRQDAVAIFAQEAPGDVSPNFRYHRKRNKNLGIHDDDEQSARDNARLQLKYAKQAHTQAAQQAPLQGPLGGRVEHVDMGALEVLPQFAEGQRGIKTQPGMWGLVMPAGTAEGPGPLRPLLPLLRQWMKVRRLRDRVLPQKDLKIHFLELGKGPHGRFLGWMPSRFGLSLVGRVDPVIGYLYKINKDGEMGEEGWLPNRVPVQLLRLGPLIIAGIPGEPTTMSGIRMRRAIQYAYPCRHPDSVQEIVINGYANGYAGYIATSQEYIQQEYEGAYTLFGQHTLGGYQTILYRLAQKGLADNPTRPADGIQMPLITYELLLSRREKGRQWCWGPGSEDTLPLPPNEQQERLKRALRYQHRHKTP